MTVSETALEDDSTQLLQLNKSALVDAVSLGQEVTMGMYFVFSCLACRQFVHFEGVCSVSLFEKSLGMFVWYGENVPVLFLFCGDRF